jgi:hypothetical protein
MKHASRPKLHAEQDEAQMCDLASVLWGDHLGQFSFMEP